MYSKCIKRALLHRLFNALFLCLSSMTSIACTELKILDVKATVGDSKPGGVFPLDNFLAIKP